MRKVRHESVAAITWLQTQVPVVLLNGWSLAQRLGGVGCPAACNMVDSAANVTSVVSAGETPLAMLKLAICAGMEGCKGYQVATARCYCLPAASSACRAHNTSNNLHSTYAVRLQWPQSTVNVVCHVILANGTAAHAEQTLLPRCLRRCLIVQARNFGQLAAVTWWAQR